MKFRPFSFLPISMLGERGYFRDTQTFPTFLCVRQRAGTYVADRYIINKMVYFSFHARTRSLQFSSLISRCRKAAPRQAGAPGSEKCLNT